MDSTILDSNAFDHPLHLALGDSAAGCVRAAGALISPAIPLVAINVRDDLSHGPLDDGVARAKYWRACYRAFSDWAYDLADAFAPWDELSQRLDRDRYDAVVVWAGENVSEATFLAMACHRLAGRSEQIVHLAVPGKGGRNYVAVHAPEELSAFFESQDSWRRLDPAARTALAEDFTRIRDETGLLRRWQQGRVIGVPVDTYDDVLLRACGAGWAPAARVIGKAMGQCDPANSLSDLFFNTRLEALIAAGKVQADGPQRSVLDYAVRRAAPPGAAGMPSDGQ